MIWVVDQNTLATLHADRIHGDNVARWKIFRSGYNTGRLTFYIERIDLVRKAHRNDERRAAGFVDLFVCEVCLLICNGTSTSEGPDQLLDVVSKPLGGRVV